MWIEAFNAREDLLQYGDNAIGLFALQLKFGIEDIHGIAADAITDGSDDKKNDIVFINEEDGYAVVQQCFFSKKTGGEADVSKAGDLRDAVSWLLLSDEGKLPERIKNAAISLRSALSRGVLTDFYVWYVHNKSESKNVENELGVVQRTISGCLKDAYACDVNVVVREIGAATLEEWYSETQTPILVSETNEFIVDDGYEILGSDWSAYVTSVTGSFLKELFSKHGTSLFSANIRDYLGSRKSDSNINNGIIATAKEEASNFWVYNNGLTAVVHDYVVVPSEESSLAKKSIKITGISIVNGAQTTGAIASLKLLPDLKVPIRFIRTSSADVVFKVVQYNNSQNKVSASDFRSNDSIQRRLKSEFESIADAEYYGGRRGGHNEVIKRKPNLLPSHTVGQALAAFHGMPAEAYNKKSQIWISDALYSKVFHEGTTAEHIVFCYSLLRAIEEKKKSLIDKLDCGELTDDEQDCLSFLRKRGAIILTVTTVAKCMEILLATKISALHKLSFGKKSPKNAMLIWKDVVDVVLSFSASLSEGLDGGLSSNLGALNVAASVTSLVKATAKSNSKIYSDFASKVSRLA